MVDRHRKAKLALRNELACRIGEIGFLKVVGEFDVFKLSLDDELELRLWATIGAPYGEVRMEPRMALYYMPLVETLSDKNLPIGSELLMLNINAFVDKKFTWAGGIVEFETQSAFSHEVELVADELNDRIIPALRKLSDKATVLRALQTYPQSQLGCRYVMFRAREKYELLASEFNDS